MLHEPAVALFLSVLAYVARQELRLCKRERSESNRTVQVEGGAQHADILTVGAIVQPADPRRAVDQTRLSANAGRIVKDDWRAGAAPVRGLPAQVAAIIEAELSARDLRSMTTE
jgi:hypothetical protein